MLYKSGAMYPHCPIIFIAGMHQTRVIKAPGRSKISRERIVVMHPAQKIEKVRWETKVIYVLHKSYFCIR